MIMNIPTRFIDPLRKKHQWSQSASQAMAILAVDNIILDSEGLKLLEAVDRGDISHDEAIAITIQEAKNYARNQIKR